jgi:hypothetical protein
VRIKNPFERNRIKVRDPVSVCLPTDKLLLEA